MLVLLLALACATPDPGPGAAGSSTDGGSVTTGTDGGSITTGTDGGSEEPGETYVGPDYGACVSDAQCEPGSWCTSVPGHRSLYCAPPCDPSGDGSECDLTGTGDLGFEASCLANGRCARACEDDALATLADDGESLVRDPDDLCPDSLECTEVDLGDDEAAPLCAGPKAGGAGFYGVCDHPNVEGTDCPDESSCFGGDYIGLDIGVCLPWCDDGTCPSPPDGTTAAPLCYDVGLDHPVCALICIPDSSTCPSGQFCQSLGGIGLCIPDGSELPL